MKYINYFIIICCVITLSSCSKEAFPKEIDWIVGPEEPIYVLDDSYSVITDDGVLVVMDRDKFIRFMDLENQNTLGQFFFSMTLPDSYSQEFFSSMFYHDNKLWFMGTDTLYVYPSKPTSPTPLRKIVFSNIYKPREFTLNSTTVFAVGRITPEGINVPFKADLSDLWNPIYDNTVYVASTNSYQGVSYESIRPKFVHNGSVFSKSEYGISITDENTQNITNYINIPDCKFELVGNYLFIIGGKYIHIYNVEDPLNPQLLDLKFYQGSHMAFSDDLTKWFVYDMEKIRVFDISDPTNIKLEKIYSLKGFFYDGVIGSIEVHKDLIIFTSGLSISKKLIIGRITD